MEPIFSLRDEPLDDRTQLVVVGGDVDLHTAPQLRDRIDDVIASGRTRLLLDLSEASFVDSTTLGALVGAVKRLRAVDGRLALACGDLTILRVFEITGLDRVIAVHGTRHEALRALRGAAPER
jgi:anti-sigma B factor antagonist